MKLQKNAKKTVQRCSKDIMKIIEHTQNISKYHKIIQNASKCIWYHLNEIMFYICHVSFMFDHFWICLKKFKELSSIFINLQSILMNCKYLQCPSSLFMSTLKPTWCGERTTAGSETRSFFPMAWRKAARNPCRAPQRYISTVPPSSKPYVSHHLTISHYKSSTGLKYNFASHHLMSYLSSY